jgi:hypothetical protein
MRFKEIMGGIIWSIVFCTIVFAIFVLLFVAIENAGAQEEEPWPSPAMFVSGYLDDWRHDSIQVFCDGELIQEEPVWIETHGGWYGRVYGSMLAFIEEENCAHGSVVTFNVDHWPQMGEVLMAGGMSHFDLWPVPVSTQLYFPLVLTD